MFGKRRKLTRMDFNSIVESFIKVAFVKNMIDLSHQNNISLK